MKHQQSTSLHSFWSLFTSTLWLFLLIPARAEKRAVNEGNIVHQITGGRSLSWPSFGKHGNEQQFSLVVNNIILSSRVGYMLRMFNDMGNVMVAANQSTYSNQDDIQSMARTYVNGPALVQTFDTLSTGLCVMFREFSPNSFDEIGNDPQKSRSSYHIEPYLKHTIDCGIPQHCAVLAKLALNSGAPYAYYATFQATGTNLDTFQKVADGDYVADLKCSSVECFIVREDKTNNQLCITKMVLPNTVLEANRFCFATSRIQPSLSIYSNGEIAIVAKSADHALWFYKLAATGQSVLVNGLKMANATTSGFSRDQIRIETNLDNDTVVAWDEVSASSNRNYFITLNAMGQILGNPIAIYPSALSINPQTTFTLMSNRRLLSAYRKTDNLVEVRMISLPLTPTTTPTTTSTTTPSPLTLPTGDNATTLRSSSTASSSGSSGTLTKPTTTLSSMPSSMFFNTSVIDNNITELTTGGLEPSYVIVKEDSQTGLIIGIVIPIALVLTAGIILAAVCLAKRNKEAREVVEDPKPVSIGSYPTPGTKPKTNSNYDAVNIRHNNYDRVVQSDLVAPKNNYEQPDDLIDPDNMKLTERRYIPIPIFQAENPEKPANADVQYESLPRVSSKPAF